MQAFTPDEGEEQLFMMGDQHGANESFDYSDDDDSEYSQEMHPNFGKNQHPNQ